LLIYLIIIKIVHVWNIVVKDIIFIFSYNFSCFLPISRRYILIWLLMHLLKILILLWVVKDLIIFHILIMRTKSIIEILNCITLIIVILRMIKVVKLILRVLLIVLLLELIMLLMLQLVKFMFFLLNLLINWIGKRAKICLLCWCKLNWTWNVIIRVLLRRTFAYCWFLYRVKRMITIIHFLELAK
jgi:hypothetical protein